MDWHSVSDGLPTDSNMDLLLYSANHDEVGTGYYIKNDGFTMDDSSIGYISDSISHYFQYVIPLKHSVN